MANSKKGYIGPRVPLEIGGLVYRHLTAYAKARNMAPAEAINAILGDWAEAREGVRNPFAGGMLIQGTSYTPPPEPEEEEDDEDAELAAQQVIDERLVRTASMW